MEQVTSDQHRKRLESGGYVSYFISEAEEGLSGGKHWGRDLKEKKGNPMLVQGHMAPQVQCSQK